MKKVRLSEVMTEHVLTVAQSASLRQVAHIFLRYRISGIPVVDKRKRLLGIVTISDVLGRLARVLRDSPSQSFKQIHALRNKPVRDIMTSQVISLESKASIWDALAVMCQNHVHTLPITRKGRLLGIVGIRDILNICLSS